MNVFILFYYYYSNVAWYYILCWNVFKRYPHLHIFLHCPSICKCTLFFCLNSVSIVDSWWGWSWRVFARFKVRCWFYRWIAKDPRPFIQYLCTIKWWEQVNLHVTVYKLCTSQIIPIWRAVVASQLEWCASPILRWLGLISYPLVWWILGIHKLCLYI